MAIVQSLSAVTLHVADMTRATAFYAALGLHAVHASDAFTSYACGDGYINLQLHPGSTPTPWGRAILYCDDVDAVLAAAVAAGGDPQGEPADAPWDERYVHVRDLDGHELSLARPLSWPVFRPARAEDVPTLLAMNAAAVPAVGALDAEGFASLLQRAAETIVIWRGGSLAGFAVLLEAGSDYASPNYRWFAERTDDFLYIDRVVVAPDHQRQGIGRALYEQIIRRAEDVPVLAEVNTQPPNPTSLAFHAALGFVEVGRVSHGEGKEVAMMRRDPVELRARVGALAPSSAAPPEGETFARLLDHQGMEIEQITSSATPDTGTQVQDHIEWVVLIDGTATVEVHGQSHHLGAGDWMLIPTGVPHRVLATSAGARWLAVHLPQD